jgi:hypothetical protein
MSCKEIQFLANQLNLWLSFGFVNNTIFDSMKIAPILFAAADFQSYPYAKYSIMP